MSIDKSNVEDILSLGHMQSGMLYHYLINEHSEEYFEQLELIICGNLEYDIFEKTWDILIKNNEMLRTVYRWKQAEKPVQIILKEIPFKIERFDFSSEVNKDDMVQGIKMEDKEKKFDLEYGPLIRVCICRLGDCRYSVIISNHHIIYDGWSTGILLKEFFQIYDDLKKNRSISNYPKGKFKDYLKWLNKRKMEEYESYWKKYLDNIKINPINMMKKKNNDKRLIKKVSMDVPPDIMEKLKEFSTNKRVTIATILNFSWGILLQRYICCDDVIFGTTVSGRVPEIDNIDNTVGLFINTIPLRIQFSNHKLIDELVGELDFSLTQRSSFENIELVRLKEYCNLKADEALFDTVLVIENYPLEKMAFQKTSSLHIEKYSISEATNYDLLTSIELNDTASVILNYNANMYDEFMMKNMLEHYINILKEICIKNVQYISEISILSTNERKQILHEFNFEKTEYCELNTIDNLFEKQVEKTPNSVALIYEDKKLTYKELNILSNKLARLIEEKTKQEDFIGIMMNRSLEMIISMIAILKAGRAYIAIDWSYPRSRINYILKDSNIKVVITQKDFVDNIENVEFIFTNDIENINRNSDNLDKEHNHKSKAYCIYTSGSTGNPKGVIIQHGSITNTLLWRKEFYGFDNEQVVMQLPSCSFDSSVEDIFTPLISGAKLVIINEENRKDVTYIKNVIEHYNITHFLIVPSLYNILLDEIPETLQGLKFITIAGELCSDSIIQKHFQRFENVQLYNEYGPSENSVCTTVKKLDKTTKGSIIGKPISNTKCFIMSNNNLQPFGIAGELCISGIGLSEGYLNNNKLTQEKFIITSNIDGSLRRVYKTGDLARWLPNGDIEFLGRIDNQIKIRGFRIEKDEIENTLLQYPKIKEVAVTVTTNSDEKELIAYIVSHEEVDIEAIRHYLSDRLPYYSVPSYIIKISEIPKNPNGKIDMKSIENIDFKKELAVCSDCKEPKNDIEKEVEKIWCKVLNIDKVSIDSKFFNVGGNSLKIITLTNLINKKFNLTLKITDLFKYNTIESIAKIIESENKMEVENEIEVYKY